jgi:hypothetical protein
MRLTTNLNLAPKLRMRVIPPFPLSAFMARTVYVRTCLVQRSLFQSCYSLNAKGGVQISKLLASRFWDVYAAYVGSCLPTFRDTLLVASSRVRQSPRRAKASTTSRRKPEISRLLHVCCISLGMNIIPNNSFSKICLLFYCLLIRYHVCPF